MKNKRGHMTISFPAIKRIINTVGNFMPINSAFRQNGQIP